MVNQDTMIIYKKYLYFLNVLFECRFHFFTFDNLESENQFFSYRYWVLSSHYSIKNDWINFKQTRYNTIKRFEKIKHKLKVSAYQNIMNDYFCYDISNLIISYLL